MQPKPHPLLSASQLEELKELLHDERARLTRSVDRAERDGPVQLDQQAVGRLSRMDALMNEGLAQVLEHGRGGGMRRLVAELDRHVKDLVSKMINERVYLKNGIKELIERCDGWKDWLQWGEFVTPSSRRRPA